MIEGSNERRYNEEEKREGTGRKDEGGATLVGRERLGTFIKRKKKYPSYSLIISILSIYLFISYETLIPPSLLPDLGNAL